MSDMKDGETIRIRSPHDVEERMIAALQSGYDDLFVDNGRVIVTGKNLSGERLYLGEVSETALYQATVDPNSLIEHVRFGPSPQDKNRTRGQHLVNKSP